MGGVGFRSTGLPRTTDLLDTVGDGEIGSVLVHVVFVDVTEVTFEVVDAQKPCPTLFVH